VRARLEQHRLLLQRVIVQLAQRRVVIEDEEPATEARCHHVVLAALDLMSRIGIVGMPSASFSQCLPPSRVMNTPNSVPMNIRPGSHVVLHQAPHEMTIRDAVFARLSQLRPRLRLTSRYGLKSPYLWLSRAT
jgi:hypothetical protein